MGHEDSRPEWRDLARVRCVNCLAWRMIPRSRFAALGLPQDDAPDECRPSPIARRPSTLNPAVMSARSGVKHVPKPGGHETIWAHTDQYVGKILHIRAGEALSVQYHNVKDETVYLLSGELIYRIWENDQPRDVQLEIGEAFRITPGPIHQMKAVTDCDILEVSTPHLDDVVRI